MPVRARSQLTRRHVQRDALLPIRRVAFRRFLAVCFVVENDRRLFVINDDCLGFDGAVFWEGALYGVKNPSTREVGCRRSLRELRERHSKNQRNRNQKLTHHGGLFLWQGL